MLILPLLATVQAAGDCGSAQSINAPAMLVLRDHTYTLIGTCGYLPVYQTAMTDSTFLDRGAADRPVILVTQESRDPTTAEDSWPAPTGNLYFSYPYPGDAGEARAAISVAIADWQATFAPDLVMTEGWEGHYGAHRGADGRFLTGLALELRQARAAIGVDLHLNATPMQYAALAAEADHVSIATLTGQTQDVDAALWWVLSSLRAQADELIRTRLYEEAAEHIFWELDRHGITGQDGSPVSGESIGLPLQVQGFARNSHSGAIVVRANTLVRCDAHDHWPEDIEGRFVTVQGRLEWLPMTHRAAVVPGIDFHDTAALQLVDCTVLIGVREEDITRKQWRVLRGAGITAALGEPVVVSGVASRHHSGWMLRVGTVDIGLHGCGSEGPVQVRGTLGYRKPYMLYGVGPRIEMVKTHTGIPDWFTIEDCQTIEE